MILAGLLTPWGVAASSAAPASMSAWQVVPSPSPPGSARLSSVSATSPRNAWAVGTIQNGPQEVAAPLAEHWNGKSWRVVPVPDGVYHYENRLFSVSAVSAGDAWAVGNSFGRPIHLQPSAPLAEHWNGRSWTAVATPKPPPGATFSSVADLGPDDAWAVGSFSSQVAPYSHTLIEHFDGTAWHIVPSPDPGTETNALFQVAASGPDDIWATGEDSVSLASPTLTLAEHWNGHRWSVVPTPDDPTASFNDLESLAVRSPTNAWTGVSTSGNANGDFFAHWNGKTWRKVAGFGDLRGEIALLGLAIVSPDQVWAAGGYQGIMTGRWDGTRWRRVPTPAPGRAANLLEAITTVPGGNELIAVGYQENVVMQGRTLILVRRL
jgi:hypothetical protein